MWPKGGPRRPDEERFWEKVNKAGPFAFVDGKRSRCWVWGAYCTPTGYGKFQLARVAVLAHRYAYSIARGPIVGGFHVLHKCDNPPCVNSKHLFLGTDRDNSDDKVAKGRAGARRGVTHPRAKLSDEIVRTCREAYAEGVSAANLAERFGICLRGMWSVLAGRTWKHVK